MALVANDVLTWVSQRVLIEPVVSTTLGTAVVPGTATVTPGSMAGIFNGAMLIVGNEVITASNVTATTLQATFSSSHSGADLLYGATFPTGQTVDPLFSQSEMLGYLEDAVQDFLLKTRPVYNIAAAAASPGVRAYSEPADAIRVERISRQDNATPLSVTRMWDVSVSDLDRKSPNWSAAQGVPSMYFEDQLNVGQFGVYPLPTSNFPLNVWYSQRTAATLTLLSPLLIPDPLAYVPYYGMMAMVFTKDGELRDPQRADYCKQRYGKGMEAVIRLLEGMAAGLEMAVQ